MRSRQRSECRLVGRHAHLGGMQLLMRAVEQAGECVSALSNLDGVVECNDIFWLLLLLLYSVVGTVL